MATPIVDSYTPARGHTGGQTFVAFVGSGFQLPQPTVGSPRPPPRPSVSITFGGVPAIDVRVIDTETVTCLTPSCALTHAQTGVPIPGKVDVVITNVDADGNALPGESVTLPAGFEYVRPNLATKSFPMWVLECLMRQLILQVVPRVDFAVHSDYRDTQAIDYERIPEAPCLVITDVEFSGSSRGTLGSIEVALPNGRFATLRAPDIQDCEMSVAGIANTVTEATALFVMVNRFFQKNTRLRVPLSINNADTSAGIVEFDLECAPLQAMRLVAGGSESNIKSFARLFTIRGIPFEDIPGLPTESTPEIPEAIAGETVRGSGYWVEEVDLTITQKDS